MRVPALGLVISSSASEGQRLTERTFHGKPPAFQYVRINLCRSDVAMPELFLHGADIHAAFQQVSGERVPQCMATCRLAYASPAQSDLERTLNAALIEVVSSNDTGAGIPAELRGWEDVLPSPLAMRIRILAVECMRQLDRAVSRESIEIEGGASRLEMSAQRLDELARQRHHPVLAALTV